jgi:hypothetical protein
VIIPSAIEQCTARLVCRGGRAKGVSFPEPWSLCTQHPFEPRPPSSTHCADPLVIIWYTSRTHGYMELMMSCRSRVPLHRAPSLRRSSHRSIVQFDKSIKTRQFRHSKGRHDTARMFLSTYLGRWVTCMRSAKLKRGR